MAANKEAPQYLFTDRKAGADGAEPLHAPDFVIWSRVDPPPPFPISTGSHLRPDWLRYVRARACA